MDWRALHAVNAAYAADPDARRSRHAAHYFP